jgi:hypothetical protein
MTLPLPTGVASWKMFLSLNERLLDQPDAASQCRLVSEILGELLKCHAELWLARPYFPLPGEPEIETLIHPDAPAPILQAVQKGELVQFRSDKNKSIHGIAHPLITQDSILGVLFLSRSSTQPFSKSEVEYIQGMAAHIALSLQISRQVVLKNWRYDHPGSHRQCANRQLDGFG